LEKKQKEQAKNKQLYQMLKELRDKEAEIAEQLKQMEINPLSKETLETSEDLLHLRQDNLEKLKMIKEKLIQSVSPENPATLQGTPSTMNSAFQ